MKSIEQKNNNAKQFNKFLLPGTATNTKTTMQNNSKNFYFMKSNEQKNNKNNIFQWLNNHQINKKRH